MNKLFTVLTTLIVIAALVFPVTTYAATPHAYFYITDVDVDTSKDSIEITTEFTGQSKVKQEGLASVQFRKWKILDQDGNLLYSQKVSSGKLNAKLEGLQPSVEYCLDIRVTNNVMENGVARELKPNFKLDADRKIILTKQGIKIKKGSLCVMTKQPTPDKKIPTPETPMPKNPKPNEPIPQKPKQSVSKNVTNVTADSVPTQTTENIQHSNPLQQQTMKERSHLSFWERLLNFLF